MYGTRIVALHGGTRDVATVTAASSAVTRCSIVATAAVFAFTCCSMAVCDVSMFESRLSCVDNPVYAVVRILYDPNEIASTDRINASHGNHMLGFGCRVPSYRGGGGGMFTLYAPTFILLVPQQLFYYSRSPTDTGRHFSQWHAGKPSSRQMNSGSPNAWKLSATYAATNSKRSRGAHGVSCTRVSYDGICRGSPAR